MINLKDLPEKFGITPDPNGNTRCKTPVFHANYVHVFEPKETPSGDLKYSIAMLWDKKDAAKLKEVAQCICNAAAKRFGSDPKKWSVSLKCPLRDGDDSDNEAYHGKLFMNCGSKDQPGVVNRQLQPLTSPEEFYSGCNAIASVSLFAYDVPANKGVGCGLNNLLKWSDGERLDGKKSIEEEFAEFAEESSDTTSTSVDDEDIPF